MPAKKKTKSTKTAATYKNELGLPLTDPAEIAQDICWTAWDIDSSTVGGKKERERLVKERKLHRCLLYSCFRIFKCGR